MTQDFPFPELETDEAAIVAFRDRETARAEAAFCDAQFEKDVKTAQAIMERDDYLKGLVRRGKWIYNFLRNPEHPKGLWRRLPEDDTLTVDADWQPVFDLDAFCAETGEDWHWRGAETAFFDPEALVIKLSWQGSDRTRHLEWDAGKQAPVPGGFDLGPERGHMAWRDADTILYATSTGEGAATRSGWPGRVVRLKREMRIEDAPAVFEVAHEDLLAHAFAFRTPEGKVFEATIRLRVIGESDLIVYPDGIGTTGIPLITPKDTQANLNSTHYAYVAGEDTDDMPSGALALHQIGDPKPRILFEPKPYVSVSSGSIHLGARWMHWIEMDRTAPTIRVLDLQDPKAEPQELALPCEAQSVWISSHDAVIDGDGPLQMTTTGFLTPSTTWVFSFEKGLNAVAYEKLVEEPAAFDATGMEVKLLSAVSEDGTEVPYHLVLPAAQDGPLPVLQYGYGGFGVSLSPYYGAIRGPLWLQRGGAYVQAYIRGGGEFGTDWHHDAKRQNRNKAFEDFVAVARDLVRRKITTVEQIACHGGSNGGLLCSVMLTKYPEDFGAVWPSVAVTDMLRFHLFPAGAGWMDEYGDPDDPEDRAALLEYSPVHRVALAQDRPYPQAFVTTNDSDDRVDPSHSRRFAAALLEAGQPAWFHSRAGGHGGGGATYEAAREAALGYAFLRHTIAKGLE